MIARVSSLILLMAASTIQAATVAIPAEVRLKPGRLGKISAATDGNLIRWINLSDDVDLIPSENGQWAIVSSNVPGTYRIAAYTGDKDGPSSPAYCTLIVGTPPPPIPPDPPVPSDPLGQALQAAYSSETAADRATTLLYLASLYQQAASDTIVGRADLHTWGDLFNVMATGAATLGIKGKLPIVQKVIAAELSSKLPTKASTPLDADGRKLATATFIRIAQLLQGVK